MKLQIDEKIIKVYRHHYIFFIWRSIKIWLASIPFYFLAALISPSFHFYVQFSVYFAITIFFGAVNFYDWLMYFLDVLIITTKRIVHLDWINPFRYEESECTLDDIQDIETRENGFLSKIKLFDFGTFVLETASKMSIIRFDEAPDPEGIKYFIVNVARNHARLHNVKERVEMNRTEFIQNTERMANKLEK